MEDLLKRIIVALDLPSFGDARDLAAAIAPSVGYLKVGSKLFTAEGPRVCELVKRYGGRCFLDLKFHDIPNTVMGAVSSAASIGVDMLTIHALGGSAMVKAAVEASAAGASNPKILAVTVLTSHDEEEMRRIGIDGKPEEAALRLASMAVSAGAHGVVASPLEAARLRGSLPRHALIITPGVRLASDSRHDQKRVATAAEAVKAGADYIVVGRPVYEATDPIRALWRIAEEMKAGLSS